MQLLLTRQIEFNFILLDHPLLSLKLNTYFHPPAEPEPESEPAPKPASKWNRVKELVLHPPIPPSEQQDFADVVLEALRKNLQDRQQNVQTGLQETQILFRKMKEELKRERAGVHGETGSSHTRQRKVSAWRLGTN